MAVKATLRKPNPEPALKTRVPDDPTVRERAGAIDVEAEIVSETADEFAGKLEGGEAPAQAVATRPVNAVARSWSGGGFEGDWDETDTKLPQLKIVNGAGELSKRFNGGSLIYNDEKLWNPPSLEKGAVNPEMIFVPLLIEKQFRENLTADQQDEGVMPRMVTSRAEAEALTGVGSSHWGADREKPRWSPSAKCVLLLQQPANCDHPGFCTELDGKQWALAVYYNGGVAYNHFTKVIRNTAPLSLRDPGQQIPTLFKKWWVWEIHKITVGKNTISVPKIRLTRTESGPEVRAFAESLRGHNIQSEE